MMRHATAASQHGRDEAVRRTGRRAGRGGILTIGRMMSAAAAGLGGFIIVNAVALQPERHPAPFFTAIPQEPPAAAMAALTPAEPENAREALIETRSVLPIRNTSPDRAKPVMPPMHIMARTSRDHQPAQRLPVDTGSTETAPRDIGAGKTAMKDELRDLVKRAAQQDIPALPAYSDRTVMDVQRALNRAGYGPVSEDGRMGPTTKAALTRFEQDRKLPPRGEVRGPVLKMLAATSGIAITP